MQQRNVFTIPAFLIALALLPSAFAREAHAQSNDECAEGFV
jgi:hypothetical protein